MRLTVHVSGAKKYKVEKTNKDGKLVSFYRCPSTLSYRNIDASEVPDVLAQIEKDKLGKVVRSYLSNDKSIGRSKGPKKKATS